MQLMCTNSISFMLEMGATVSSYTVSMSSANEIPTPDQFDHSFYLNYADNSGSELVCELTTPSLSSHHFNILLQ